MTRFSDREPTRHAAGRTRADEARGAWKPLPATLLGLRWDGSSRRGHVESWYVTASEPGGSRAFWARYAVFVRPPLPPVAEVWSVAFDRARGHVAVKTIVPFDLARFAPGEVDLAIDGATLSLERARGALTSGRGSLSWDLSLGAPLAAPVMHLAFETMYRDGAPPPWKLVTPIVNARASGIVRVGRGADAAERWDLDGWPVMLGHDWGTRRPEMYASIHCSTWRSLLSPSDSSERTEHAPSGEGDALEGLVFEALSARTRFGPLLSPMATSAFVRYGDRSWNLAGVRSLATNRGAISLRRWEMTGADRGVRLACEVAAENDDFVGLHYENPAGSPLHVLGSRLARARIDLTLPGGERILASSRAASLEIGTILPDHGIEMAL